MYDDLVFPSFATVGLIASSFVLTSIAINIYPFQMFFKAIRAIRICDCLASIYYAGNPCAESLRLPPSAIGQRRIVGCWRGQVPLRVCSIQSSTVPALKLADRRFIDSSSWLRCLAIITTAGGRPILDGLANQVDEAGRKV